MKRSLPSLEDAVRILRTTHTRRAPKAPPSVVKQVKPLLKSLEAKFAGADDGSSKLRARWPEIVGEQLSRICEPVRIITPRSTAANPKAGALEIRVTGAFAPLIQHQATTIIDRVNLYLGGRKVERLRLIQGPLTALPSKPPKLRPQPLSASEEVRLQEMVSDVPDDALRKTLLKLGRAVMRRNRDGHN